MGPELSRLIRHVTFVLLVLASMAVEIAAVEQQPVLVSLGWAVLWTGLALALGRLVPAPPTALDRAGQAAKPKAGPLLLALLVLLAAPFLFEPFRRQWTGTGYPLELQLVFALRNLGLGLAVFAGWPICLRLAAVVSFFLMLFSVSLTDHRAVLILLALYSAAGSIWLMLVHWTGLRRYFTAIDSTVALEVQPGRERLPWLAVIVVVGLVGLALSVVAVGPQRLAGRLGEWLPTSGGTGDHDPFARGGLNDGDDEVQGANARSTGMIASETFLDSPLPSLYDRFSDVYGEPFKPKERERAIALDGNTRVIESSKPPANNLRPNREFPTTRRSPRTPPDPSDRAARALFEVQGRTPLHLRATAFDLFDGIAWQEAPSDRHTCLIVKEPDSCWMRVEERTPALVFAESEEHQFKMATSFGSLVPAPPHLTRFRIGRVDQPSFFAWGPERILLMGCRRVPSGICVETEARTVDRSRLSDIRFPTSSAAKPESLSVPARLRDPVRALAHDWTVGKARGWEQIDAIVQRLRTEYVLDPMARVPDDCTDPLGHFLLVSKRGPDYQFASAAAVLLRVQGYPTRLVSGFYVAPDHYDPLTRHTPVVWEDLHFWAELMLPAGDWLVIEPTPGYEVLGPNLSWSERLLIALVAVAAWAGQNVVGLIVGLLLLGGMWHWRRELLDILALAYCRFMPVRSWELCTARTVWLLELRGRWAGRSRPSWQTVSRWLHSTLELEAGEVAELARMAEWAAYAPDLPPPWDDTRARRVCSRVLGQWTLRRFRAVLRQSVAGGTA